MATLATITIPSKPPRNHLALAAKMRRGGTMKHKAAARGGNTNVQRDLLGEYEDELLEDELAAAEATTPTAQA